MNVLQILKRVNRIRCVLTCLVHMLVSVNWDITSRITHVMVTT